MPIYEYKCQKCDNEFEYLVVKSTDVVVCQKCNDPNLTQIPSLSTFELKGQCWEKDGYTREYNVLTDAVK